MSLKLRIRNLVEYWGSRIIGTIFWPPTSVAVLAEQDDQILVLRIGDHYELPGGIIKAGELPKEAGKREVKEETGYDVELGDLLDMRTSARGNTGIHYFFEGTITSGEKDGSWEGTPEFLPKEEIKDKRWRPHHQHIHDYLFPNED